MEHLWRVVTPYAKIDWPTFGTRPHAQFPPLDCRTESRLKGVLFTDTGIMHAPQTPRALRRGLRPPRRCRGAPCETPPARGHRPREETCPPGGHALFAASPGSHRCDAVGPSRSSAALPMLAHKLASYVSALKLSLCHNS